jgi:hypothetical protein
VRFIGKDGDNYFHSILMLKPDQGFGIFVAYNGQSIRGRPLDELLTAIADRYFLPSPATTSIKPFRTSTLDTSAYAGVYQDSRRSARGTSTRRTTVIVPPMFISILLISLTLILWPFAAVVRRLRLRSVGRNRVDKIYYVLVRAVLCVVNAVLAALIAFLKVGPDHVTDASDPWLLTLYAFAWLCMFGAALAIWVAIRFWRAKVGGLWWRIHHTGLAVAISMMVWFFVQWHVAGTTLKF